MNKRALHFYHFGPFRLNATERVLQRGAELVPLSPKVFDTLLVLVENCGHVVDKNDLMQVLWPDSFVEESSLTQNISLLRRALAENGEDRQYIETIPKRGYRFVADVREVDEFSDEIEESNELPPEFAGTAKAVNVKAGSLPGDSVSTRKWPRVAFYVVACGLLLAGLIVLVQRSRGAKSGNAEFAPKSIAVLPFKTIGTNGESELLGLGMADALIIKLSRLEQFTVLPTSSVFRYTSRNQDAVAIGKSLLVEGVLDGTVQRDGDRVRVSAQLIRLSDGKTVWSGKFDERYGSIFALQDSISDQVTASLSLPVIGKNKVVHATENTEAYQAFLTGLYFWNRRTKENLPKAIGYLEQAVQKDPDFARAHAILADCHYLSAQDEYGMVPAEDAFQLADASLTRALELDDRLAEAHTTKAGLMLARAQFDDSGREFRRALDLNPSYAVAHLRYGYYLLWDFRLPEAVEQMRRAQELDPVSPVANSALAGMLVLARDYDNSIKFSLRSLELEPNSSGARLNLADAYLHKRMFAEALHEFDKIPADEYVLLEKSYGLAAAGRRDEALKLFAQREKQPGGVPPFAYARFYGAMDDLDKAFAWLDKIRINRYNIASLKYDPQLDSLRADPRFADFLKRHQIQ